MVHYWSLLWFRGASRLSTLRVCSLSRSFGIIIQIFEVKKNCRKKQKPRRNQGENINVLKTIGALYCGRGFINMTGTLTNFIYWGLLTVNLLWALQKHAFCIVKLSASSRRLKSPRWVNQSCSQTLVLNMFQRNKSVLPRSSRWVSWG